jgi:hypothetical protein
MEINFKNILRLFGVSIVFLAIGGGVGYYYAPEKIVTKDKIVEKEVTKIIHEKFDPVTGKVTERTTTDETKNTTETKSKVETLKPKKHYAIKGGVATDFKDNMKLIPRAGVEIRLPFFDSWIGVEGDINLAHPIMGLYGRMEF